MSILKFRATDPAAPVIPPQVQEAIVAANSGDASALPALRRALAEHPELIDRLGDLAAHAERLLISHVSGPSLAASEAVAAHLAKVRQELGEATDSSLEGLLVVRVSLCWLACHAAEIDRGELLRGGAGELLKAADKRLDRAHARLLAATKTLATVRKLLAPATPRLTLLPAVATDRSPQGRQATPAVG